MSKDLGSLKANHPQLHLSLLFSTDDKIVYLGLVMSIIVHLPSMPYGAGSPGKLQPVPPLASMRQESATVSVRDTRLLDNRDAGLDGVLGL